MQGKDGKARAVKGGDEMYSWSRVKKKILDRRLDCCSGQNS